MTDQKAAGEVEAKAEAACLAWMRECNEDSATGDEMRAFEAGYEAACHQRDQRIAELATENTMLRGDVEMLRSKVLLLEIEALKALLSHSQIVYGHAHVVTVGIIEAYLAKHTPATETQPAQDGERR